MAGRYINTELLGRSWFYFELNILASVYIRVKNYLEDVGLISN